MDIKRTQLIPGVALNYLHSDKFKTACMSVTMLTQLERETASLNALIPMVLRRGTSEYTDMEAISARLDELYGTAIEPSVRRIGEIQCLGFFASVPEEDYLPKNAKVLSPAIDLICQMLLSPAMRGGLLLKEYVDDEREKLVDIIRSRINEKTSYALWRCMEEMCCCEAYGINKLGSEDAAESIRCKPLSGQYKKLLAECPIEIFYCGKASEKTVADAFISSLAKLPRAEINYDIGTEIRMNSLEENPRCYEEELDVNQGKLIMGFRLGDCMDEPDKAVLNVFNTLFGSGTTSKLFTNVREKLSLCYFASSIIDMHKGVLFVASGIDVNNFGKAKEEILAQLRAIADGDITDDELASAKACVASELRSITDIPGELEGFYLSQILDGFDYGPQELAALTEDVTKEDVSSIARSMELDMVYFLKGGGLSGEEGEPEDDEA